MPKKITTNKQLVNDLIDRSPHGLLSELFVVEAIAKYAEACAKADPETMGNILVNGAAWKACAQDIKARMDAFYGRQHKPAEVAP